MGKLAGLEEYLAEKYNISVFDNAVDSRKQWAMHVHNNSIIKGVIKENLRYDIKIISKNPDEEVIPKIDIKLVYPDAISDSVGPLLNGDKKVKALGLQPISAPAKRYHVKNKSLFPLMKERKLVFFTLLEGEVVRGIIAGFSRYEITLHMKGGVPVTILRHSIYDLRDKNSRCYLKSYQETRRDWEKSPLYGI
ncbi:MAG TPA: hypothetical protein PLQ82_15590, partial [Desulfobacteraceae bacterium]|nr:hypothetical protein [Desulfobacteraceae bacterium]HPQ29895.1 hypothetical protein [Desulfobacteraceae bacterium]